jgi:hypothetical protein
MIKKSKHEEKISKILTRWQIEFEFQKKFQDCIHKLKNKFDFGFHL